MTNNSMSQIYTSLSSLFCALIILGNLTYQKFVTLPIPFLHDFELSVGAILYPLTFLITDLIAEFYGRQKANFCVKLALAINIIVVSILYFMDSLTATSWSKIDDQTFHGVFGYYGVAFMSSLIACYISQYIDVILYLKIRNLTHQRMLWLRNIASTSVSLFVDTCVVIVILVIAGVLPKEQMLNLIVNSYSWKLFFSVCCIPVFYFCFYIIKANLRLN